MTGSFLLPQLPHSPGVYLMRDRAGNIVYIGKARDLKKRVASYFPSGKADPGDGHSKTQVLLQVVRHVDYVTTESEREALVLERRLIRRYQPTFNTMWKDDKSYPYVSLTMGEDFPRLLLTREKRKKGKTLYFGPYPNVGQVRRLLKWTWRNKLFPLRPCHLDIREEAPLPYAKVKSCLYLHTGECPAPCVGKISSKKYKDIAKRARLFFEGRNQDLAKQWEKDMKRLSRAMEYEKAGEIRDRLEALNHLKEPVTFRHVTELDLRERVGQSRAVQLLAKELNLKKPPHRIECIDISHTQGQEKVASLVRFDHGRPNKAEYRKYIIRSVEGIDDVKAMAETVERRFKRLQKEKRPSPDLLLVDGGKGQLSATMEVLTRENIRGLSVAAIAKKEEELFMPGKENPIHLSEDSPALLLLRHIRDEAHRFAVSFHRKRRGKAVLRSVGVQKKGRTHGFQ